MNELGERWERLYAGIESAKSKRYLTEVDVAEIMPLIAKVHLVQEFNWMKWGVPYPEREAISSLSLEECIKHVTRVCRSNRFNDGALASAIRSGFLESVCRVAQERAGGQPIPPLSELGGDS